MHGVAPARRQGPKGTASETGQGARSEGCANILRRRGKASLNNSRRGGDRKQRRRSQRGREPGREAAGKAGLLVSGARSGTFAARSEGRSGVERSGRARSGGPQARSGRRRAVERPIGAGSESFDEPARRAASAATGRGHHKTPRCRGVFCACAKRRQFRRLAPKCPSWMRRAHPLLRRNASKALALDLALSALAPNSSWMRKAQPCSCSSRTRIARPCP